jgi:hypothetical protein
MPSWCARARAPSTASGEQQALAPSVSGSAQSLTVMPTTSAPSSRASRAATALSTPPDMATATRREGREASLRRGFRGDSSGRPPVPDPGAAARLWGDEAAPESARCSASVASWAAWRLAGARPPIASSTVSILIRPASKTRAPSIDSATAAVAARVAPQPSASKVTEWIRPSSTRKEIRERSPQAAPPAAPVKAPSAAGPSRLPSRR